MIKRFCLLLACLLLLICPALAEQSAALIIQDDEDLLTPLEENQLLQAMQPITAYGAAAFWSTRQSGSTDVKAERFFDANISPLRSTNGIVFMIDMYNREIYIFTRGDMERTVSRAGAYAITDNVYRYASKGDYYTCARSAFEQALTLIEGGRVFSPMRVICNLLLAVSFGILSAFLIVRRSSVATTRKTVTTLSSTRASVQMQLSDKRLVRTIKRRKESSSGGGRIGGFSGGGGGGSHGGGGSGGGHGF